MAPCQPSRLFTLDKLCALDSDDHVRDDQRASGCWSNDCCFLVFGYPVILSIDWTVRLVSLGGAQPRSTSIVVILEDFLIQWIKAPHDDFPFPPISMLSSHFCDSPFVSLRSSPAALYSV